MLIDALHKPETGSLLGPRGVAAMLTAAAIKQ